MAILLDKPDIVPAAAEKVYDEVWLSFLQVNASDPNAPTIVNAVLSKGRTLEDGSKELKPNSSVNVRFDFFKEVESDPELLTIMGMIITKLKKKAGV